MSDLDRTPTATSARSSRRSGSRPQSLFRPRSSSRPRTPPHLSRVYSGRHLDDTSLYHGHHDATRSSSVETDLADTKDDRVGTGSSGPDANTDLEKQSPDGSPILENRGGILTERDRDIEDSTSDSESKEENHQNLDADVAPSPAPLEKARTLRSEKSRKSLKETDPKLVRAKRS